MRTLTQYFAVMVFCLFSAAVQADPPNRVARLSNIDGNVSFLPAGTDEWLEAARNRPLITGDRLWNDTDGFSRLQLGGAQLCIGPNTNVNVLNLDNNIAQFQLTEGSINLEISAVKKNQSYEIDTPNVAFTVQKPGNYRIDVDKEGDATIVQVAQGQAQVYGDNNSYIINNDEAYQFKGTNLDYDPKFQAPPQDDFDKWCAEQHQNVKPSSSTPLYVSQDVIGYEDLESAGTWESIPEYGEVWAPNDVGDDWAPYRNGHWAWIEPWGWNWIGEESWGFAPYHYGRWVHHNRWYWVPYADEGPAVYCPALVAFIGAAVGYGLAGGWDNNVGWFPLGPGDIYRPPYSVSYNYFYNVNRGDRIHDRQLRRAYRDRNMRFDYRNRNVANSITAVPRNVFRDSQNVNKARIPVNANQVEKLTATSNVNLKPQKDNANRANRSRYKPSDKALSRPVISKSPLPKGNASANEATIRTVKPSKPRDISTKHADRPSDVRRPQDNRPSRDLKRQHDDRFNVPLPNSDRHPPTRTPDERFRQSVPEYDPTRGHNRESDRRRDRELRRQERLDRQQEQLQQLQQEQRQKGRHDRMQQRQQEQLQQLRQEQRQKGRHDRIQQRQQEQLQQLQQEQRQKNRHDRMQQRQQEQLQQLQQEQRQKNRQDRIQQRQQEQLQQLQQGQRQQQRQEMLQQRQQQQMQQMQQQRQQQRQEMLQQRQQQQQMQQMQQQRQQQRQEMLQRRQQQQQMQQMQQQRQQQRQEMLQRRQQQQMQQQRQQQMQQIQQQQQMIRQRAQQAVPPAVQPATPPVAPDKPNPRNKRN